MQITESKLWRQVIGLAAAALVTATLLSGCGQTGTDQTVPAAKESKSSKEPIALKVYQTSANISDEEFQRLMVKPVKKKFPNISLELVRTSPERKPEQLVASDTLPDLIFGSQITVQVLSDLGAALDLTPYLKKYNVSLDKFDPSAVKSLQARSPQGQLLALPFSVNFGLLYYNKDIFDKFAVPYPKNDMTWDTFFKRQDRRYAGR
jgi:multiple sugar transport system substrate-binding protein